MFISYIWRLLIWKKITFLWTKRGGNRNESRVTLGEQSLRRPPGRQISVLNTACQQQTLFPSARQGPIVLPTALGACVMACSHSKGGTCLCFYRRCDMPHLTRISGVCSRKEAQQRVVVCWSDVLSQAISDLSSNEWARPGSSPTPSAISVSFPPWE